MPRQRRPIACRTGGRESCARFFALLEEFYRDLSDPPAIEATFVAADSIPQPQRDLLVHFSDMTSTLTRHWGERLALKVLQRRQGPQWYRRHIVLETEASRRPVEYGAMQILLPLLSEAARRDVLAARAPLGAVLACHGLAYRHCPGGFFTIRSNSQIERALGLTAPQWLYGRCNCLSDRAGAWSPRSWKSSRRLAPACGVRNMAAATARAAMSDAGISDEGCEMIDGHENHREVVVVGGGPAGSTAAAVLAMHGRDVLLLEKEKFPRYHVGESLLPFGYFPLQRIGMVEKLNQSHFPRKYAVQFAGQDGRVSAPFYFHKHMQHEAAVTWQVLRSEFDHMLLENAREKGVEVRQETKAAEILREDGRVAGVMAVGKDGRQYEVRAKMTIDASGRDIFTLGKTNGRKWDPALNKMAVWTYYRGALRDPGIDAGSTTVAFLPERGWFWYIPLSDDVVSVGVVAEKDYLFAEPRDLADVFGGEVEKNLWIKQHLAEGRQFGKYYTTREYSYRGQYSAENGLVLVGDAFAFLDPVFSSGVYLALRSGELAADTVHEALWPATFPPRGSRPMPSGCAAKWNRCGSWSTSSTTRVSVSEN